MDKKRQNKVSRQIKELSKQGKSLLDEHASIVERLKSMKEPAWVGRFLHFLDNQNVRAALLLVGGYAASSYGPDAMKMMLSVGHARDGHHSYVEFRAGPFDVRTNEGRLTATQALAATETARDEAAKIMCTNNTPSFKVAGFENEGKSSCTGTGGYVYCSFTGVVARCRADF